jgi:protein gp37
MGDTGIEWTNKTWNPIVGCSIVSPGCTNCYAMRTAGAWTKHTAKYAGLTQPSKGGPVWTGGVRFWDKALLEPLSWKAPVRCFVNSMGDLFHEEAPDEWIDRCFAVMALAPQHQFQILTKRPERMRAYMRDAQTPFRVARQMDAISSAARLGPEEIRPIEGYPGYFVSSHGNIYSEKRGSRRRLKPDAGEQGHMRVPLYRAGDKSYDRLLVHRIVLEAFVGPPPTPETQGRHRDGNPANNAESNLRWGDQEANWADSLRHGTHRRYSKLTDTEVAAIRRRHAEGESAEALGREFPVSATQVRNIAAGKQWAVEAPIEWPLRQIWLGVSAERQQEADERIPLLLDTPAAIRFVSAEPLLGSIDIDNRLDWVIVGGESGPHARPMHPDWARGLRDQCQAAGVPFFFKQWGAWLPGQNETHPTFGKSIAHHQDGAWGPRDIARGLQSRNYVMWEPDGTEHKGGTRLSGDFFEVAAWAQRVGKKAAGRLLDGREWNEFPEARAA